MQEVKVQADVPAPLERVWARYADLTGWESWSGIEEVVVRQPGEPAPSGLGTIRVLRSHGIAIEEEVVAFEPQRRIAFQWVAGLPLREHEGEVYFESLEGATRVIVRMRFRPLLPGSGGLLARLLRPRIEDVLQRLGRQPCSDAGPGAQARARLA
jgi:uncharacterized membrane protein